MIIEKQDKEYLITSKIKVLQGLKNRYLDNDQEVLDSIEDIESQIQALTNLLEML
jgi:hypothetical protein